jgi:hypothetical protein
MDGGSATLHIGRLQNAGKIIVNDSSANERIRLDGHTGDVLLQNADCAEDFDRSESEGLEPGTVVAQRGRESNDEQESYDKKVAGVVSAVARDRDYSGQETFQDRILWPDAAKCTARSMHSTFRLRW